MVRVNIALALHAFALQTSHALLSARHVGGRSPGLQSVHFLIHALYEDDFPGLRVRMPLKRTRIVDHCCADRGWDEEAESGWGRAAHARRALGAAEQNALENLQEFQIGRGGGNNACEGHLAGVLECNITKQRPRRRSMPHCSASSVTVIRSSCGPCSGNYATLQAVVRTG